jgi:hypothetical protein
MFNFFNKTKKINLYLNCKTTGLQFHNNLIATEWNNLDVDKKGNKPIFYTPYTKYDKKLNMCLLLTGYSFNLEDEKGEEQREVVKVFDVLTGTEQYSWEYGWGHLNVLKGNRIKNDKIIKEENEAIKIHKKLIEEFSK